MLRMGFWRSLGAGVVGVLLVGCGGPDAPSVAPAGGIVKFKGSPLAGASVMFVPDNGPLATGTTDLSGKFTLRTGTLDGAVVGKCKVTVTAVEGEKDTGTKDAPPTNAESGQAYTAKMMQDATKKFMEASQSGGQIGPKSIIPEKYSKADSSGLSFTVEKDASKNQFTIELN